MSRGTFDMAQLLKESDAAKELKTTAEEHLADQEITAASAHDGVDERALLRKMDLQFIPWLSFLYFLSFLDRTSIGNARVFGDVLRDYALNSLHVVAVWPGNEPAYHGQAVSADSDYILHQLCSCFYLLLLSFILFAIDPIFRLLGI